jgi:hypothetical protein
MPICYFNQNYEKKYSCEYSFENNLIIIEIDYDITSEIKPKNGIIYSSDYNFNKRDILLLDFKTKEYYLLKDAFYSGMIENYGIDYCINKSIFKSYIYFKHKEPSKVKELLPTPKIKKIKIFSFDILNLYNFSGFITNNTKEYYSLIYDKNKNLKIKKKLNTNNIKSITVGNSFNAKLNVKNINIDIIGYIELELFRRINYDEVNIYVNELITFMQLYYPNKFSINKLNVNINDLNYDFFIPYHKIKISYNYSTQSVNESLIDFLSNCYSTISLRQSNTIIKNIPYIVTNTSRNIEDNFLMFYRFIECYYKNKNIPNIRKSFISYSIENNYKDNKLDIIDILKYTKEIICLRNKYVHSGYHLKNASLKVKFDKNDKINNYTVNSIDFQWINERTKILYSIVIDIIFSEMLNYDTYNYINIF